MSNNDIDRAKIVKPLPDHSTLFVPAAWIFLIDEGTRRKADTNHLYEMPDSCSIQAFPPEIVEVWAIKFTQHA